MSTNLLKYDAKMFEALRDYLMRHTSLNNGEAFIFSVCVKRDGEVFHFASPKLLPQGALVPHEHLQVGFDYICAGCGELVVRLKQEI